MTRHAINPKELFDSLQYGFSQIVVSQGSRIVSISGQVAWDERGQIVGPGDLRRQTFQALKNLETAMRAAGGTLGDIASLRIYIAQAAIDDTGPVRDGLLAFFPDNPPATTWIGVPALARPEFLIEIEVFAVLD